MKFCTYLVSYKGNKLPPFYIGYTSIDKIDRGYRGSVCSKTYGEIFHQELKQHPELFKIFILSTHDSRLDASKREEYVQLFFKVHRNPMYINMNISGKHFNSIWTGRKHTPESINKMSKSTIGQKAWNLGLTKETCPSLMAASLKISKKAKGRSSAKKGRKGFKGYSPTSKDIERLSKQSSCIEYTLQTPDNELIIITNLKKFCNENNLSIPLMYATANGKQKHHKRYKIISKQRIK